HATGRAERESALQLLASVPRHAEGSVGADRAYDTRDFVLRLREQGLRPHIAQNTARRRSAIDARTTRFEGYRMSQKARKRVEHPFGWIKAVAGLVLLTHRSPPPGGWGFPLPHAAS